MAEQGDQLTPRQHRAILALLSESSITRAAKRARVGERTLRTWLKTDQAFLAEYRVCRRQVVEQVGGRLQRAMGKAVATLVKRLTADKDADAIRAATVILEQGGKAVDLWDFETRLSVIERRLAENQRAAA